MAKPEVMNLRKTRPDGVDSHAFNVAVGTRLREVRVSFFGNIGLEDAMPEIKRAVPLAKQSTWYAWEIGNRSLSAAIADKIGWAFDVAPIWILYGEGEKRPYPSRKK